MPNTFDFGGINLTAGGDTSGARPTAETPFNIAILGDFSGRASRGISDATMWLSAAVSRSIGITLTKCYLVWAPQVQTFHGGRFPRPLAVF